VGHPVDSIYNFQVSSFVGNPVYPPPPHSFPLLKEEEFSREGNKEGDK